MECQTFFFLDTVNLSWRPFLLSDKSSVCDYFGVRLSVIFKSDFKIPTSFILHIGDRKLNKYCSKRSLVRDHYSNFLSDRVQFLGQKFDMMTNDR